MNKEWSNQHKEIQLCLKKEVTFAEGIEKALDLRNTLWMALEKGKEHLSRTDYDALPFLNHQGYDSKTIAYSLWHIFRIEDMVAHTLILEDEQVFYKQDYLSSIHAPLVTTGNELKKQAIAEFSKHLDINELYQYGKEVMLETNGFLKKMTFQDLKQVISASAKKNLLDLKNVSSDEGAIWLVDYWCGKEVKGLILMPFLRHWIMHVEASIRIMDTLYKDNREIH